MSIDLGLEYLQINKPSGSLFEAYNNLTTCADELRDANENLIKSINAMEDIRHAGMVVKKYGRTRSLEAFVGSDVIYSCEEASSDSWLKQAWNAVLEFFRKLWTKLMNWIKSSEFYVKKINSKLDELIKKNFKSDAKFKVYSISKKFSDEINAKTYGAVNNVVYEGITVLTSEHTTKEVFTKKFENPTSEGVDNAINRGAYDSKIDKEGVEVTGSKASSLASNFKNVFNNVLKANKELSSAADEVGKNIKKTASDSKDKEAIKHCKNMLKCLSRCITYMQEAYLADVKVINSFISGASKAAAGEGDKAADSGNTAKAIQGGATARYNRYF